MQLKDMKITQHDEEPVVIAVSEMAKDSVDRDRYPWGLSLTMNKDVLEKLGVKATGFEPGKAFKLVAKAEVESVNINKSREGRHYGGTVVEMQITELGLEPMDDFGSAWEEALEG